MTNKIAIGLALLIFALFAADAIFYDGTLPVFLGKKLIEFITWISFWR